MSIPMNGTDRPTRRSGKPEIGEPVMTRAFRVLSGFDQIGEALGLGDMAARADLPKSTTVRIAAQLVNIGALERSPDGNLVIGLKMLEIASVAPRGHGLRAASVSCLSSSK